MFGIHPCYNKFTRRAKTVKMPLPPKVTIPLTQHIGAPNVCLVDIGAQVKTGQVIGKNEAFVSSFVHSSISGRVMEISDKFTPIGIRIKSVTIQSDGKDEWVEKKSFKELTNKEKILKLKEMGLVGMGGATFPSHVKLTPPDGKKIEKIIVNGAECEPYLTCDNRNMIENGEKIIDGLKIVMELAECKEAIIGIESNKPNAIRNLEKLAQGVFGVKVVKLPQIYPQGAEKVLINQLIGKFVPAGGLPIDIGCVVFNVSTLKAISEAINNGIPLVERIVTVTGDVNEPKNVLSRIGTSLQELVVFCGGYSGNPKKIISGGPMMGIAQFSDMVPVMKGTSGVLVLNEFNESAYDEKPCIKCAKCVDVCPMNLVPVLIARNSKVGNYQAAKEHHAMDCFECGCCAYSCPSKIPLVQLIKDAKSKKR